MMMTSVTSAAGRAILKFSRNLSFIAQPWPWQAAMVVSEMNDRLSPNMAPPMTLATHKGRSKPEAAETATAMGVINVMVPTDVPIDSETKQLTMNSTTTANSVGKMASSR
mgnify:CR=1 FL=1